MFAARARLLIATAWVGSLWTVGFVVAPTLFATIADRRLAGSIAGSIFRVEAWLSIACFIALALLLLRAGREDKTGRQRNILLIIIAAMLACTLAGYFGLQPYMASLRAAVEPGGIMTASTKLLFGVLHGAASVLYLTESLLGVALMFKIRSF